MPGDEREGVLGDVEKAGSELSDADAKRTLDQAEGQTLDLGEEDLDSAEAEVAPRRGRAASIPPPVPGGRRSRARTSGIPAPLPHPDMKFDEPSVLGLALSSGLPRIEERILFFEERCRAAEEFEDNPKVALYSYETGELLRREVKDSAQAARAFGRALKADPTFRANIYAVRQVFAERGHWDKLTTLCDGEVELARTPAEAAEIYVEQGRVFERELKNLGDARQSYERALAKDPGCAPALFGIERIALNERDAALLARAWRGLCDLATDPARKQAMLIDLAGVQARELGDAVRALATLREAAALSPLEPDVEREREVLALKLKDAKEAIVALEGQIAREPEKRDQALLRRRVGRIFEVLLGDTERAWAEYARALETSGGDEVGLFDLAELADKGGRYTELAELTADWAAREADPERALDISLRRVRALMRAGKVEDAARLLDKLGATAPAYLPVLTLREQVALLRRDDYLLATVWYAIAEALAAGKLFSAAGAVESEDIDPRGAMRHFVAAGDLFDNLGDEKRAEQAFRAAVAAGPDEPGARFALGGFLSRQNRFDDAFEVLAQADKLCGSDPTRRVALCVLANDEKRLREALGEWAWQLPDDGTPLHWLEAVAHHHENHTERADVLERLAELTTETDERARFFMESARLYDRELKNSEKAIELYRRVNELWPDHPQARTELASLYSRTEAWDDLLALLNDATGRTRPEERAICADVLATRRGKNWDAALIWKELCDRAPEDEAARQHFVACLRREVWTTSRPEAMSMLSDALAGPPPEAGGRLDAERGVLCERSADLEQSLSLYRQAATDGSRWAAWSLLRVGASERDADACARSLDMLRKNCSTELAQKMAEESGWFHLLERGDVPSASAAFGVAGDTGSSVHLGRALVAISAGRPAEAAIALRSMGRDTRDVRLGAAALTGAASFALTLGDSKSAEACLCEAAEKQPESSEIALFVTDWLADLVRSGSVESKTFRIYARACRVRAEASTDRAEMRRWLLEQARILLAGGDTSAAHAVCLKLFGNNPDDPAMLQVFRDVCLAGGQRRQVAELTARLGQIAPSTELRVQCLREAAQLFDRELGLPERAVVVMRHLLELEPGAPEFARARDILFERDDSGGLFELFSLRLETEEVAEKRSELLVARAQLRRRYGDAIGSDEDLAQAVGADPGALWELAALAMERDNFARAIDLLKTYCARTTGERKKKGALRLGDILESQGDLAGAAAALEQIGNEGTPADRAKLELRVAKYYSKAGKNQPALEAYARAFEADPLSPVGVRAVVEGHGARASELLRDHAHALRTAIAAAPADSSLYEKLHWAETQRKSKNAFWVERVLAVLSGKPLKEAGDLEDLSGTVPEADLQKHSDHPELHSDTFEVFSVLGPRLADLRAADPIRANAEKIKKKEIEKRFPFALTAARAFGLTEFELYLVKGSPDSACAPSSEPPALYLPASVAEGKSELARLWLGRTLRLARTGVGTACEIPSDELAGYVAAAAAFAEVQLSTVVQAESRASLVDCKRRLDRVLGRRDKKALRELEGKFANLHSIAAFRRAALVSGARAGLLLSTELPVALRSIVGAGYESHLASDTGIHALMTWVVSDAFVQLRSRLFGRKA